MQQKSATVLYVEDEETDIFFMQRAFSKTQTRLALRTACTGEEAIDYLDAGQVFTGSCPVPTVVLLDLNLPGLSGFEVLTWIRQQPRFHSLPVVVFTSSEYPEDRAMATQLGATDYWVKPGSTRRLQELIGVLERDYTSGQQRAVSGAATAQHGVAEQPQMDEQARTTAAT